jgi:phosphoserine phosphatase RsbU/P
MRENDHTMSGMGNMPEKDKVYIVGGEQSLVKDMLDIFSDNFLKVNRIDWNEILNCYQGYYVILSAPSGKKFKEHFRSLLDHGSIAVCIYRDNESLQMESDNLLTLPYNTPHSILSVLIPWIYLKFHRQNLERGGMNNSESLDLIKANKELQKWAIDLEAAYEALNKKNLQLKSDLALAVDVQKSLLPKDFPTDLPINFFPKYLPSKYIGGDFYDIIRLDKDRLGIIISDVSGHGVAAAFITAMFKSAFSQCAPGSLSPAWTLSELNRLLGESIHTDHYVTAFYAIFDLKAMEMTYSNAGHPRQLLCRGDGQVGELGTKGFFIGMFKDTEFEEKKIAIKPGDRFFFFTDGIIEIQNEEGVQFGKDGLKAIVQANPGLNIKHLSDVVLSELMMYMKETAFPDDITLLITEIMEDL